MQIYYNIDDYIYNLYKTLGISLSDEISEITISNKLDIIYLQSKRSSYSYYDKDLKIINVDSRTDKRQQRELFFHELGHILMHCGTQIILPLSFVEYQEYAANKFVKKAAIPYHMLKQYDLSNPYITRILSRDFVVSERLCYERLTDIKQEYIRRGGYDGKLSKAGEDMAIYYI